MLLIFMNGILTHIPSIQSIPENALSAEETGDRRANEKAREKRLIFCPSVCPTMVLQRARLAFFTARILFKFAIRIIPI